MLAPVRVKNDYPSPDENDPAGLAREITSRHKVDRRSLFAQCRVSRDATSQPHLQRLLNPLPPLGSIELARANAPPSLTTLLVDLSCVTLPTGCRTEVIAGKTSPFADGQDASRRIAECEIALRR